MLIYGSFWYDSFQFIRKLNSFSYNQMKPNKIHWCNYKSILLKSYLLDLVGYGDRKSRQNRVLGRGQLSPIY